MEEKDGTSPRACLCIDGGGVRGIAAFTCISEMARDLKSQYDDFCLHQIFDTLAGVSIGGFLISLLREDTSILYKTVDDLFTELSQCISYTTFLRIPRKQNSSRLLKVYQKLFKKTPFYAPDKVRLIIPCYNITTQEMNVFDSHVESDVKLVDVIMATTAHPLYFLPHKIENYTYIDGGVARCNPVLIAAAVLDQGRSTYKYFSIGTGEKSIVVDEGKVLTFGTLEWVNGGLLNYMADTHTTDFIAQQFLKDRILRISTRSNSVSTMNNISQTHVLFLKRLGSSWYWKNRSTIQSFLGSLISTSQNLM